MHSKKSIALFVIAVIVMILTSGCCNNWQKKFNALNVSYQNVKGQLDRCQSEKGQLAGEVAAGQQTIEELQQKIEERNQSPAVASGFGEGYDVSVDAQAGTVTVTLPNAILFSSGKAALKSATQSELDHIAGVLTSKYTGMQYEVVGHTDSDPIKKSAWADNWELSAQRSLAVLRYLVKRGVPAEQVRAAGRGASIPVAPNTSSSGKAQNRRVEIVVHMR